MLRKTRKRDLAREISQERSTVGFCKKKTGTHTFLYIQMTEELENDTWPRRMKARQRESSVCLRLRLDVLLLCLC